MGAFVTGNTPLPPLKTDKNPPRGKSYEIDAADINNLWAAAGDLRTYLLGLPSYLLRSWDDLPAQYIMGHRGTANTIAPENTFAAFDVAAALPVPIETDVQMTIDGVLVHSHDFTVDRATVTSGSVDVRHQSYHLLKTFDFSAILPGPSNIYVPQRIPTFDDYLRRYRGNLLIPEIKDEDTRTGTAMANLVKKYGMQRSVVITDFSTQGLAAVKAVDPTIKTLLAGGVAPTAAAAAAAGVWGVSSTVQAIDGTYVATLHAAGFKVHVYNLNGTVQDLDLAASYGVDGIYSDDPVYYSICLNHTKLGTTVIDPPATVWQVGGWKWFGAVTNTPTVTGGFATFSGVTLGAGTFFSIQIAARTANTPTTQTISTTLKAVQTNGDTTRYMGVKFAWNRDNDIDYNGGGGAHNPSGYFFSYRQNGGAELHKIVAGADTLLTSATWATYAVNATIPIRIDVTAASITVTRTDNSQTITANDTSLSRGGLIQAIAGGMVPGIGSTTITY